MKTLKAILFAFIISTLSISVTVIAQERPSEDLMEEIIDLIGSDCPYDNDKKEFVAVLHFTFDENGEMVIISVKSPNPKAESYLKRKLDNQKIDFKPEDDGITYLFPVRIVKLY